MTAKFLSQAVHCYPFIYVCIGERLLPLGLHRNGSITNYNLQVYGAQNLRTIISGAVNNGRLPKSAQVTVASSAN